LQVLFRVQSLLLIRNVSHLKTKASAQVPNLNDELCLAKELQFKDSASFCYYAYVLCISGLVRDIWVS